jgi:hypothetical protein
MSEIIPVLAKFDVILIAIMLSGTIVQVGRHKGKVFWDSHFKGFYLLFGFFIFENVCIAIISDYVLMPFFEVVLPNDTVKVASFTATLILGCCIWFMYMFEFKRKNHPIPIIACVIMAILTIALFSYF